MSFNILLRWGSFFENKSVICLLILNEYIIQASTWNLSYWFKPHHEQTIRVLKSQNLLLNTTFHNYLLIWPIKHFKFICYYRPLKGGSCATYRSTQNLGAGRIQFLDVVITRNKLLLSLPNPNTTFLIFPMYTILLCLTILITAVLRTKIDFVTDLYFMLKYWIDTINTDYIPNWMSNWREWYPLTKG